MNLIFFLVLIWGGGALGVSFLANSLWGSDDDIGGLTETIVSLATTFGLGFVYWLVLGYFEVNPLVAFIIAAIDPPVTAFLVVWILRMSKNR